MLWNIVSLKSTCPSSTSCLFYKSYNLQDLTRNTYIFIYRRLEQEKQIWNHLIELTVSCGTTPIDFRRLSRVTSRISWPSILICEGQIPCSWREASQWSKCHHTKKKKKKKKTSISTLHHIILKMSFHVFVHQEYSGNDKIEVKTNNNARDMARWAIYVLKKF